MLKLELSPLWLPMLHSGSSPPKKCTKTFREKFKCAFKIYSIWPQASTLQTHIRNAVPLVWGSLRLTPSTYTPSITQHTPLDCLFSAALQVNCLAEIISSSYRWNIQYTKSHEKPYLFYRSYMLHQ